MRNEARLGRSQLKLVRDTDDVVPLGRLLLDVVLMLFGAPSGCVVRREPVAARLARPASALTVAAVWVM
jgi:hypothetical protein